MIIVNGLLQHTARVTFTGAKYGARTISGNPDRWIGRSAGMNKATSVPSGYRGGVALVMAQADGGLAATLTGSSDIAASISAAGNLSSALSGSGSLQFANLAGGLNASAVLSGGASLAAPLKGKGNLTCSISIGARPSATDIAQAVWEELLSGHTTAGSAAKKLKDGLTKGDFLALG